MKREKLKAGWINTIHETVDVAVKQAVINETEVEFDFNGINVVLDANTNTTHLLRDYFLAHLMKWKEVGPNPPAEYSQETLNEIAEAKAEEERKDRERQLEYDRKQAEKQAAFDKEVEGIELEFSGEKGKEGWEASKAANQDGYGGATLNFAENWARLMQKHISEGKTLQECANADSTAADTDGITGFMYGMAVNILAITWKHGEELRKWHNKEYGQPEATGTVNPAVLTISTKD